jgi:RNA polymerase sigma-70 factor, ECF subfamily
MVLPNKQVVSIDATRQTQTASVTEAFRENLDGLYRFALRLTGNPDQAQDLTQEAATRAWERQNTIVRNARAWLFQTLYHAFISHRRHVNRWKEVMQESWEQEEIESCEGPLPTVIVKEDVRRAIEALPGELRAVVWLSDAEEFRLREISKILDCPIGTVASRLWRARKELRLVLSAYGPQGEKQS